MPRNIYFPTNETRIVGITDRVERLERRPLIYTIVEEIKVFSDRQNVKTGDGRFKLTISDDVVGLDIIQMKIYITTTGSGPCTCTLWNDTQQWDVLNSGLTIAAGSYSATTTLSQINETRNHLQASGSENDRLWLNVDAAAGKGLGWILTYGRDRRP